MGIGTSAKLVIAPKPLLSICAMPIDPPMKNKAATMFAPRNAIATGMPTSISTTIRPSRSVTAQYHAIGLAADVAAVHEPGAVRAFSAHEKPQEFNRHHAEGKRHKGDQHPARHVKRTHVFLVAEIVVNSNGTAVPRQHQGDRNARDDDQLDEQALQAF